MNFGATIVAKFDTFYDLCMPYLLHYFIDVIPYFYFETGYATLLGAAVLAYQTLLE